MQAPVKALLTAATILAGLLAGPLLDAQTAAARPARQGADLIAQVQAAVTAYTTGDKATMRTLFDPAFQDLTTNWPADTPPALTHPFGLDAFLQAAGGGERDVLTNCTLLAAATVQCDAILAGGPLPPLPHPYRETAVFRFANGKIVREEETLSAATAGDLSALFATLAGGPPPGQPSRPGGQADLLSIIQQFVTAYNAGDTATLGNLFDPSYQGVITNMPPNAPPQASAPTSRAAELQNAGQRLVHVTASNCMLASADSVKCDIGLSGGPTANLPHPYTETAVFTLANGKIVRLDETLSETTRSDFAAIFARLQPPGMPTTGAPDGATGSGLLFFLLAWGGLLLAVSGAVLRWRGAARY